MATGESVLTKKDFVSDQEVRWCPGCGDYSILAAVQSVLPDLGDVLRRFKKVIVAELNMGQLLKIIRAEFLIDALGFNKVQGRPFKISELVVRIQRTLEA